MIGARHTAMLLGLALGACAPTPGTGVSERRASPTPPIPSSAAALPALPSTSASAAVPSPKPLVGHAPITADDAAALLFPGGIPETQACKLSDNAESVRCWIRLAYADDAKGLATALAFYDELGAVPGLEHEHVMEGGFRGSIHIVPERPIGQYQRHFDWALEAQREIKTVFDSVETRAGHSIGYAYRPIGWKFMRSVGRTTPSAYAEGWRVGYNVSGSLNTSMKGVRDTLVHEIFHLNDEEHHDWSRRTLGAAFDGIVARCGTKLACLTPYAPMKTTVRGGTYYAFQPDNGDAVHEYAAELASRYFLETRAALRHEAFSEKPFKCGPEENRASWSAIVAEFFGGVDLSPDCP